HKPSRHYSWIRVAICSAPPNQEVSSEAERSSNLPKAVTQSRQLSHSMGLMAPTRSPLSFWTKLEISTVPPIAEVPMRMAPCLSYRQVRLQLRRWRHSTVPMARIPPV